MPERGFSPERSFSIDISQRRIDVIVNRALELADESTARSQIVAALDKTGLVQITAVNTSGAVNQPDKRYSISPGIPLPYLAVKKAVEALTSELGKRGRKQILTSLLNLQVGEVLEIRRERVRE